jgi:RNA polymerase sigma factor (sigma-70 family)
MNEPQRDPLHEGEPEPADDLPFDALVRGLVAGENPAYTEFWERYGKRLKGVVRSKFPLSLKRRLGPEDLVQSACRSFFRRVTAGELQLQDGESLWRLLCAIALNKMRMKHRFHYAQRRGVTRERDLAGEQHGSTSDTHEPAAKDHPPDEAIMFAEQLEQVLSMLDSTEQRIVQLKLEDFTNDEIATKLRRSERTIRRSLKRLQAKLEAALCGDFTSPFPKSP